MLYVRQSLGPDEELIHMGQFHWMYNLWAVMNIFWGALGCGVAIFASIYFHQNVLGGFDSGSLLGQIREIHPGFRLLSFFIFVMGLLIFAQMMVVKATTEIAITNERLIYKRGLVARHVVEISIDRIEGVNVLQSVLGRIMDYGRVMVRGMGVGEVVLPPMAEPVKFRKAIEQARNS